MALMGAEVMGAEVTGAKEDERPAERWAAAELERHVGWRYEGGLSGGRA